MRQIAAMSFIIMLGLICCAQYGCEARGSMERVAPYRLAPQPPEAVTLYLDDERTPDRPYHLIARIESDAGTRRFGSLAEAEAAALDKLRELAARAGARAVIDIEQTVTMDDDRNEQVVRARGKAIIFRR